jgi:hypothetical protein
MEDAHERSQTYRTCRSCLVRCIDDDYRLFASTTGRRGRN